MQQQRLGTSSGSVRKYTINSSICLPLYPKFVPGLETPGLRAISLGGEDDEAIIVSGIEAVILFQVRQGQESVLFI